MTLRYATITIEYNDEDYENAEYVLWASELGHPEDGPVRVMWIQEQANAKR